MLTKEMKSGEQFTMGVLSGEIFFFPNQTHIKLVEMDDAAVYRRMLHRIPTITKIDLASQEQRTPLP